MKKQHLLYTMAIVAVCNVNLDSIIAQEKPQTTHGDSIAKYDGYDNEWAADTATIKETITVNFEQPLLVMEKDTIDLGTLLRSDVPHVEHILFRCNSNKDVRIKKIRISNSRARVSVSPLIPAGANGTIVCIIDKRSIALGEHKDVITIHTENNEQPIMAICLKYKVTAK